jgi:adenylosuccinate synthase
MRVGDLELADWKDKYKALAAKHLKMLAFFDVDIQFDLEELEAEFYEAISVLKTIPFIDSEEFINNALKNKQSILAEGAQGSLLDIDFGTYPFVTSSNTTAAGACTGLGVAPSKIGEVFGIFKAYTTRVGSGPFPTELFDDDGKKMAKVGNEFGATTGRPRRCGWLDLVALKYAVQINGTTQLMMMKVDVLSGFDKIKACTSYNYQGKEITHLPYNIEPHNVTPNFTTFESWKEDLTKMSDFNTLPKQLKTYIKFIEDFVEVPVKIVSVGPDRKQTIKR